MITKNSKICIATYYDKNFEKIGSLSLKTIKEYAKKYNLDVVKYEKKLSNRPPAWNKILVVKELLRKYDFVVWIDADAVFVRFDEDLRQELEEGKDFYISLVNFKNRLVPNSGFFIFRKSPWTFTFIDKVWNKKEYTYHNYWENAAIIDVLGYKDVMLSNKYKLLINKILYKTKLKSFLTKLSNNLNTTKLISKIFSDTKEKNKDKLSPGSSLNKDLKKVKYIDTKWNSLPGKSESRNPIVNHYPSRPFNERFDLMTLDLQKSGLL